MTSSLQPANQSYISTQPYHKRLTFINALRELGLADSIGIDNSKCHLVGITTLIPSSKEEVSSNFESEKRFVELKLMEYFVLGKKWLEMRDISTVARVAEKAKSVLNGDNDSQNSSEGLYLDQVLKMIATEISAADSVSFGSVPLENYYGVLSQFVEAYEPSLEPYKAECGHIEGALQTACTFEKDVQRKVVARLNSYSENNIQIIKECKGRVLEQLNRVLFGEGGFQEICNDVREAHDSILALPTPDSVEGARERYLKSSQILDDFGLMLEMCPQYKILRDPNESHDLTTEKDTIEINCKTAALIRETCLRLLGNKAKEYRQGADQESHAVFFVVDVLAKNQIQILDSYLENLKEASQEDSTLLGLRVKSIEIAWIVSKLRQVTDLLKMDHIDEGAVDSLSNALCALEITEEEGSSDSESEDSSSSDSSSSTSTSNSSSDDSDDEFLRYPARSLIGADGQFRLVGPIAELTGLNISEAPATPMGAKSKTTIAESPLRTHFKGFIGGSQQSSTPSTPLTKKPTSLSFQSLPGPEGSQ